MGGERGEPGAVADGAQDGAGREGRRAIGATGAVEEEGPGVDAGQGRDVGAQGRTGLLGGVDDTDL